MVRPAGHRWVKAAFRPIGNPSRSRRAVPGLAAGSCAGRRQSPAPAQSVQHAVAPHPALFLPCHAPPRPSLGVERDHPPSKVRPGKRAPVSPSTFLVKPPPRSLAAVQKQVLVFQQCWRYSKDSPCLQGATWRALPGDDGIKRSTSTLQHFINFPNLPKPSLREMVSNM
ncbi:uncharacterized protein PHA67_019981 [Liasis olivaceus]